MTRDFDLVLDEALSRLEAGEAVGDCLTSYPEQAGLLEPLLRMAAFSQRALADVEPYPENASATGKQRLLAAAAQQRLLAAAAVEHVPAARQKKLAPLPKKRLSLFALRARGLAAAALTLLLLVILGGGLAVVSADSLPGDLLYPVKLATEQVRLFLTVDAQAREELLIGFGEERRAEAAAVLETGRKVRVAFEGTLQSFSDSLWIVGGLQVTLDAHTVVEGDPWVGATVAVEGLAPGDGSLLASQLTVKGSRGMQEPTATVLPTMAPHFAMTPFSRETNTACPTRTHEPETTCTSCPTRTYEPTPPGTSCPRHTLYPTETREPDPTPTLHPTNTEEPMPTHPPEPTATDEPEPTHVVHPTKTKEPMPTAPPQPTATEEPEPTHMAHPKKTPHH
jgi:hypothetical protein